MSFCPASCPQQNLPSSLVPPEASSSLTSEEVQSALSSSAQSIHVGIPVQFIIRLFLQQAGEAMFSWETLCSGIHEDVVLTHAPTLLQTKCTPSCQRYSLMAVASLSRIIYPAWTLQNWSGMVWRAWAWVRGDGLQVSARTQFNWVSVGCAGQSMEDPPHNL